MQMRVFGPKPLSCFGILSARLRCGQGQSRFELTLQLEIPLAGPRLSDPT